MKIMIVLLALYVPIAAYGAAAGVDGGKSGTEYAIFAEGRQSTGDSSAFSNVSGYTDQTAMTYGGGVTVSFRGRTIFFTTGAIYAPRTFVSRTDKGEDMTYTVNGIDIPAWIGLRFGSFALYGGADAGFKFSSSQSNFAAGVSATDESIIIAPQAGIEVGFSRLRVSAFYEMQTKIGTVTVPGLSAEIRGKTIGARIGFTF